MLWVLCFPKPRVKRDVVIADLEIFPSGDNVDLPSDAVDDQPVADLLAPLLDGFH